MTAECPSTSDHASCIRSSRLFDGDGALLRIVSEADRIRLAHLFDPYVAVNASSIEPLPHQITAVYGEMLPRQPLRFLLADDPGAGKTVMAGLFIKELLIRGDLERCLVVAPGSLVEQWQDELASKFGLSFDLLTRERIDSAPSSNPFAENDYLIARLDVLSRNKDLQRQLKAAKEWDLVVCDEAHRMTASLVGGRPKYTKRYQLGQILGSRCRHFLLMTATPHNGKEEDFRLFMALLDPDRFEGQVRSTSDAQSDASDLLRRLTKEELVRFDGRPLFPERRAHTAEYKLSPAEADLYFAVTSYVREEMDRAERFAGDNDSRRQNVGFALQVLQRRLASSPAAIHQSLRRRRERLEARLQHALSGTWVSPANSWSALVSTDATSSDVIDLDDLEEAADDEVARAEAHLLDHATTALTIEELETEIDTLRRLEVQARDLRRSGTDTKWRELASLLDHPLMIDASGNRRKLIVFTEPRDTLEYLAGKIRTRLGRGDAVVVIHGGIGRRDRRKAVDEFMYDPHVLVMVANDAAGEGINLQHAHLMVNYDLPWNPNRLEQRFGRIHRIGQKEVCHLWNLVARDTREGEVYCRLLQKLDTARSALGGRVYDVLGRLFREVEMRDLLMEAIRYGEQPEVKDRLFQRVDGTVDRRHLLDLLDDRALVRNRLSTADVRRIREEMERAQARRLQPHYIESFFVEAFRHLGGSIHRREAGRYEITRVPQAIRDHKPSLGCTQTVLERYERVCFDESRVAGPPVAICLGPGQSLLDATIGLVLARHREVLAQGAVLVDERDDQEQIRLLVQLESGVHDCRKDRCGHPSVVSRRLQFVEVKADGTQRDAGPAPYLDYRPIKDGERSLVAECQVQSQLSESLEDRALEYARETLAQSHAGEVREQRLPEIDRVEREVTARLKREILFWDNRALQLRDDERAGKAAGSVNAAQAAMRADDLQARLKRRRAELAKQRSISALPPAIRGRALVVPIGLLRGLAPDMQSQVATSGSTPEARAVVERLAMEAVMAAEQELGREPRDVSAAKLGYDIESRDSRVGCLHFIEVKGRANDADTVTVTHREIRTARNMPDSWILAIVLINDGQASAPRYVRRPFRTDPDFNAVSVTYNLRELLTRAEVPR